MLSPVPGADRGARRRPLPGDGAWGRAPRASMALQSTVRVDQVEEVIAVARLGAVTSTRSPRRRPGRSSAARSAGTSASRAGASPPQRRSQTLRFAAAQPVELGDGEARHRDAAAGCRPTRRRRRAAHPSKSLRIGRRLGVVPQLGRSQHVAGFVQHDEAVLLRRHGEGGWSVHVGHAGLRAGGAKRRLPVPRVLLAARRRGGRMWRAPETRRRHRCRGRGPAPCSQTWTSRPRPRAALTRPEEQFGDELVESLVPVALRRPRPPRRTPTTGSRRGRRPARCARAAGRPWQSGARPGSRGPRGNGGPSRPGSGRSACSPARSPRRPSLSSVRYGCASKCRMPPHSASSSSRTT